MNVFAEVFYIHLHIPSQYMQVKMPFILTYPKVPTADDLHLFLEHTWHTLELPQIKVTYL